MLDNVAPTCCVRLHGALGIKLTSDFTWSDHVDHVISKVNQRLGLLHTIKHLLPFQARLLFYNSVVLPIFDYADLVWGDKNKGPCKRTQHVAPTCWVQHVVFVCTPCWAMLHDVGVRCVQFETSQIFCPTHANISFVLG